MPKAKRGKPSKPVDVFINAQGFLASANALNAQPQKPLFFWPMVVNEALALELLIKCLHRVRRRTLKGHDIHALYGKLSVSDRKKIAQYYNEIVTGHPMYEMFVERGVLFEIDAVLQRSKDTFKRVRYWHEYAEPSRDAEGISSNAGAGSLCDAIRRLLLELNPAWRHMRLRLPAMIDAPTFDLHLEV
jgi:hypothetical protein